MADTVRTVRPSDDLAALVWELAPGAVVLLEPGEYAAPVTLEHPITLRASGPGVVLDAGGRGPVVAVSAMEGAIALEGLTLQSGVDGEAGGSLRVTGGAEVSLTGCTLRASRGGSFGGGALLASDGRVTLTSCRILENAAERGGTLIADGTAQLTLVGCLVARNDSGKGAVIRARDGARVTLRGTTLVANTGAAALSVEGSMSRAPELLVEGSIIDHGEGPILGGDRQPPRPGLRFTESVLHGLPPLHDTAAGNVVADPQLDPSSDPPYRPRKSSPARARWTTPQGPDLTGTKRPTPATAGAVE